MDMLRIESTSGKERALSEHLSAALKTPACKLERWEVGDGTENLLFSWGEPEIVFCSHMDTVPPYIAPSMESLEDGDTIFRGRGTCDAKGQIFALYSACLELERRGHSGFGLLLLSGEETGSFGAKAFRTQHPGGRAVIVGEPTDGSMVSASKGTKSFALTFHGKPFHSGYPKMGESAIDTFYTFLSHLKAQQWPKDELLGETTWNIGKLSSDNPQNILSERLECRLYFRTTFASDSMVERFIAEAADALGCIDGSPRLEFQAFGGDTPMHYTTLEGFPTKTVAFGSDTPQLTNFPEKILCGPGSILVAHRPEEQIRLSELESARDQYVRMFETLKNI